MVNPGRPKLHALKLETLVTVITGRQRVTTHLEFRGKEGFKLYWTSASACSRRPMSTVALGPARVYGHVSATPTLDSALSRKTIPCRAQHSGYKIPLDSEQSTRFDFAELEQDGGAFPFKLESSTLCSERR